MKKKLRDGKWMFKRPLTFKVIGISFIYEERCW